ncbi:nucleotidyltransferase domain-containing protein [Paenibacillus phytohabitans]|uniref:nucleotidyltransferase domain-containing protein n=1 Tax=Paenibacillus phytohabitans TaxID=2654978 RepID=UPI001FE2CFB9|nr:nucleotidyltransferase domain-containing protein [Paenibacillus phytohabitans]
MNEADQQELFLKNEKLINMVIERAKQDYPEEIAMIGLTGSFRTGDFHDKSDLDLIIINNNHQGWGISSCFILGMSDTISIALHGRPGLKSRLRLRVR